MFFFFPFLESLVYSFYKILRMHLLLPLFRGFCFVFSKVRLARGFRLSVLFLFPDVSIPVIKAGIVEVLVFILCLLKLDIILFLAGCDTFLRSLNFVFQAGDERLTMLLVIRAFMHVVIDQGSLHVVNTHQNLKIRITLEVSVLHLKVSDKLPQLPNPPTSHGIKMPFGLIHVRQVRLLKGLIELFSNLGKTKGVFWRFFLAAHKQDVLGLDILVVNEHEEYNQLVDVIRVESDIGVQDKLPVLEMSYGPTFFFFQEVQILGFYKPLVGGGSLGLTCSWS